MFKLISIDLDDTLWPCMPTIERAENLSYQWLQQHCPVITEHYSLLELRDRRRALMVQQEALQHNLSAARLAHFSALADEFSLGHEWIKEAFDVYFNARQQVDLYDDVAVVLAHLQKRFTLVALTNGNADIQLTGVGDYFALQISAADVNAGKPDPAMFYQMIEQTGIEAKYCLHVGDHPRHDIQGAANAGVRSVWINRQQQLWPETDFQPDYKINNLHQLISVIESST